MAPRTLPGSTRAKGAGTGPYRTGSCDPTASTTLVRYDDCWGGFLDGQIDTAEFRLIENPVLAGQLSRDGEADYTFNPLRDQRR